MQLEDLTTSPLPTLPPRRADSHKGDYGRALLVGGSRGMSGAIALSGLAALRSGAGLVTLAVPRTVQDVVAAREPSYMTHALADENRHIAAAAADEIAGLTQIATAVAIGPGLGRDAALTDLVASLFGQIDIPMVVDADALFHLAQRPLSFPSPRGPRVLTPHPGEFGPLSTKVTGDWDAAMSAKTDDNSHRQMAAACLAKHDPSRQTIVVLKGHASVVTDGLRASVNQTGNPGMATGGTGDVLTGIITALLCQGLTPFDAARLGAHVHGLAGDLAADELGQISLIASDLIDYLPQAFQTLGVST